MIEILGVLAAAFSGISGFAFTRGLYLQKKNNVDDTLDNVNGKYIMINLCGLSLWFIYHFAQQNMLALILVISMIINLLLITCLKYLPNEKISYFM